MGRRRRGGGGAQGPGLPDNPAVGDLAQWDGTEWVATGSGAAVGNGLVWNGTLWVPGSPTATGAEIVKPTAVAASRGLWLFNDTLTDASASPVPLNTPGRGTGVNITTFTDVVPGVRGLDTTGTSGFNVVVPTAKLQILGEMTIEVLVNTTAEYVFGTNQYFFECRGDGELEADNWCYGMNCSPQTSPNIRNQLTYFAEEGAGTNITAAFTSAAYGVPRVASPWLLTYTRTANGASDDIRAYVNGRLVQAAITVSRPTGGTNSIFGIAETGGLNAVYGFVHVRVGALNDAQVLASYNAIFPQNQR